MNKLNKLNKMLYADDYEVQLLAINLIKEEFNWLYLEAIDETTWLPASFWLDRVPYEERLLYRLKLTIAIFNTKPIWYKWYKLLKNILNLKI